LRAPALLAAAIISLPLAPRIILTGEPGIGRETVSWQAAIDPPTCETLEAEVSPVETVIVPRACDLGAFEVRQVVGPFIFSSGRSRSLYRRDRAT
jgi:hypothetical protein